MSSSDVEFIAFINNISAQINRYLSIFIFLFGTFGNIFNIIIFSQRCFRKNSCAILFMASSIANCIAILSGLTSRMLSGWAVDLTNTDRFLCKLRAFTLNVARPVAFWLILLAAIDRWLLSSSNVRLRQISTLKNAYRAMIIIIIGSIILFSHIIYCYEPNLMNSPLKCYGITLTCRFVTDISFTLVTVLIPILFMFIFGLMTIKNIHESHVQTRPRDISTMKSTKLTNVTQRKKRNKTDSNLLLMLLAQVALLFIFGLPLGIQKLYATITVNRITSNSQVAIDNFVYNFVLLLNFLANGMPFYIYTLVGGNIFRKEFVKVLLKVKNRIHFR